VKSKWLVYLLEPPLEHLNALLLLLVLYPKISSIADIATL
jgi:hypothetical protein